ncbi:hypothetical protein ONZ43_g2127 [Nemania bipapillata]|uniref:Uncharacterized protein n=1 Tax=Nemania bipapillata TaxID=110536 RepID=A0ACC2J1X3_9PEZI|nr:hypothetical protein ONZ43_g2127 [Nemania bipapillata]
MFSRIKDAIDRTLAEEQARHKASNERQANADESAATFSAQPKQPALAGSTNPDPAVFEAAFKLEDESEPSSRATTPKPAVSGGDTKGSSGKNGPGKNNAKQGQNDDTEKAAGADTSKPSDPTAATPPDIPPNLKSRLKKLDRLEATYQELLRSYRIAHSRIEPFERALRENTPLTSIKDPAAFVEYLNQLNLKTDMVLEEMKRISAERDELKKKNAELDEAMLASLKNEVSSLKAAKADAREGAETEDIFSYDDEIPTLQAALRSRDDEITELTSQIGKLRIELDIAKEVTESSTTMSNSSSSTVVPATQNVNEVDASTRRRLEAQDAEVKSLREALEQKEKQLVDTEAKVENERSVYASMLSEKKTEIEGLEVSIKEHKITSERLSKELSELTNSAHSNLEAQEKTNAESKRRIEELTKELDSILKRPEADNESLFVTTPTTPATPMTTGSGKKNRRKKKGGASAQTQAGVAPSPSPESPQYASPTTLDIEDLRAEVSKLKDKITEKDSEIEKLSQQRKTEANLRGEITNLQESLVDVGEDLVEAKERIKQLETERSELQSRISELEQELSSSAATIESHTELETRITSLMKELDESKSQSKTLQSDLGAAQKLALDRFKSMANLKDIAGKALTQVKSLQQDCATLETTKEELASKQNEIRTIEKREKDAKAELVRVTGVLSDRDFEIKRLQGQISSERTLKAKLEDEKRKLGRDCRRLESEKAEMATKSKKTTEEVETAQQEVASLRPKVKQLEDEVAKLQKENNVAKEDVDLKTQQYNNAQGLLAAMRDQSSELSMQLKEARDQADSLEEERAETQKHLTERTREAESMRRMLAGVNEQADANLRDMRSQMEAAKDDYDRAVHESATLAKQHARDAEELRNKVRDLERDVKVLGNEREDLKTREKEWRQQREELEQTKGKTVAEVADLRSTVSALRSALEASEQQFRDAEKQRADLKKLLDESRSRYERTNTELKSLQSRLAPGSGPSMAKTGRSSTDSTRSTFTGSHARGISGGADISYLRQIFLQFLEVKDDKLRIQLIPVLGKLLGFDKYGCL